MHRMAKAAEWPLWILASAALGSLFGLLQIHPAASQHIRITRDMRLMYDARMAAVALVFGIVMLLATGTAQRRRAERRKDREARREAARATLLKHADPVAARQDEHEREMGELRHEIRGNTLKVETLLATFADVLEDQGDASDSLRKTQPLPLYLAAKDGEIVSGDKRDTA